MEEKTAHTKCTLKPDAGKLQKTEGNTQPQRCHPKGKGAGAFIHKLPESLVKGYNADEQNGLPQFQKSQHRNSAMGSWHQNGSEQGMWWGPASICPAS